jgi:DNA-binding MarR family transcriptional regulator
MPTQRPPHFGAYMQFLRMSAQLRSGYAALGVNEFELFEEIVLAWAQSKPLSVSQAIGIKRLGAHATLFARLAELRQQKLIETIKQDTDVRTKYLIPTGKGLALIRQLAEAMAAGQVPGTPP